MMAIPLKYGVYHSVVVTSYANEQIIYNDPLTSAHRMISINELKAICDNNSGQIEIAIYRKANKNSLTSKVHYAS